MSKEKLVSKKEWQRCLFKEPKACINIERLDKLMAQIKNGSQEWKKELDIYLKRVNIVRASCHAHEVINRDRYKNPEAFCVLPCVALFMATTLRLGNKLEGRIYQHNQEERKK